MNLNQRTVNIKIKRGQLVDIMILCAEAGWMKLHDELRDQLKKADAKLKSEAQL